jgi:hypothetical protein
MAELAMNADKLYWKLPIICTFLMVLHFHMDREVQMQFLSRITIKVRSSGQAIRTIDNGYTFIGNTKSVGSGSYDVFLVHTDANGDTLFTRAFGTSESESGLSVIQTADGGYAICGRQQTFPNGIPESDGLIIKTDGNGDMLWSYIYGDTMWEEFESIRELPNGHFAISGSTVSFGQGNYDILLLLIDSAGVPLNAFAYGGQHADACYDLHITDTFCLSGYTESSGTDTSDRQYFSAKSRFYCQLVWMIAYGDGLPDEAFVVQDLTVVT